MKVTMPKKIRPRYRRNSQNSTENNKIMDIQQEKKCLRDILEERNMYQPRMRIQEMRDLCSAVEKSEMEYSINKYTAFGDDFEMISSNIKNDQDFLRQCEYEPALQDTEMPEELLEIDKEPFDELPLPLASSFSEISSMNKQSSLEDIGMLNITEKISPKRLLVEDHQSVLLFPEVLSDDDCWYSPELPGPCCKVEIITLVEIHSEPCDMANNSGCSIRNQLRFDQAKKLSTIEWDLIEELL